MIVLSSQISQRIMGALFLPTLFILFVVYLLVKHYFNKDK